MHLIETFDKSIDAVTKVLKTVVSYMLHADDKLHEDVTLKYAPKILKSQKKISKKLAIIVFDIDDTVLFGNESVRPNANVIRLLKKLKSLGAEIHLVTARQNDPDILQLTVDELNKVKLTNEYYTSLSLAPEKNRDTMADISKWKLNTRKDIAAKNQIPITLTVGDQWGDMMSLKNDETIEKMNEQYSKKKYHFVRPDDKVSLWGLKLPSK